MIEIAVNILRFSWSYSYSMLCFYSRFRELYLTDIHVFIGNDRTRVEDMWRQALPKSMSFAVHLSKWRVIEMYSVKLLHCERAFLCKDLSFPPSLHLSPPRPLSLSPSLPLPPSPLQLIWRWSYIAIFTSSTSFKSSAMAPESLLEL